MPDIPGNTTTTATLTIGGTATDVLEANGDHDWFRITLTAGQKITITINGITLEDPYLYLRDASGNLVAENDDISSGVVRDSRLTYSVASTGTYYIDVGAYAEGYSGSYTVAVEFYTPPQVVTYDTIANHLSSDYWGGDSHHFNVTQGGTITVNLTGLTTAGQTLARAALQTWSDVIGVTFSEVSSGGQIVFDDNESGAFSDGIWSNGIISSARVNVSAQWLADYGTGLNTYSFQTYVHEIGHALGLGHGGYYNSTADYDNDARFANDGWPSTVMSYFDQTESTYWSDLGFTRQFVQTPMVADIRAMGQLYGLSTTTRTGDTIYGFNNNTGRPIFNAAVGTVPGLITIVDNGGIDTLNYSGFNNSQLINLNPEAFSNVGGGIGNVSIAFNTIIENAMGGNGDDVLIGNSADNVLTGNNGADNMSGNAGTDTLIGGAGNDRLDGGNGIDTASYASAFNAVIVNLATGSATSRTAGDAANVGNDILISIENIVGGNFGDLLTGDSGNNRIEGGLGNDEINGGGGIDILVGGGGSDIITGGIGNDIFQDSVAGLSGDTLVDFSVGDAIVFTDATLAGFTFSLTGNTLTYTGGSLTLSAPVTGALVASAAVGGGVQVVISTVPAINDVANDFNGDGRSDILWRNVDGQLSNWLGQANGGFVENNANAATVVPTSWTVVATGDINGDGRDDILWRHTDGTISNWLGTANGGFTPNNANGAVNVPNAWAVVGLADFNGDGRDDILWRNTDGTISNWLGTAAGGYTPNNANAAVNVSNNWQIVGLGDFNGDGRDDILWRNTDGTISNWLGTAAGGYVANDANAAVNVPNAFQVVGTGDFNGDGRDDILWRDSAGNISNWLGNANGGFTPNGANSGYFVPLNWDVVSIGDYNGDGRDDILWRNGDGTLANWLGTATGGYVANDANSTSVVPNVWVVQPADALL